MEDQGYECSAIHAYLIDKRVSNDESLHLLFPLEWDDTIKLIGGSIMEADSNFQACLWFDHSSYSKLPVGHK